MAAPHNEEDLLRSVALKNAGAIQLARQRAEDELLRTREELRHSQERLTAALAASGTCAFRWEIESNALTWAGDVERLLGVKGERLLSRQAFLDVVHSDDRDSVRSGFERSVRDGSPFDMEFRVVGPDGDIRWVIGKARVFPDEDGRPFYMTGACADVTNRKQAEEALRENEQRLRAIVNQAAVGIAIAGLDGRLNALNKKFSDILGYTENELIGVSFEHLTAPDDRAATRLAIEQLLGGWVADYALEKRYLRKDGSIVWSRTSVALLKDAAGNPEQFIGIIEDITARKQAESALQEETRILELLNETGKTLASQLELKGLVQAVTDAGTQLSGAKFGAFFYNSVDEKGESYLLYTLSGAPRAALEGLGQPRATPLFAPTFRGEGPIRLDDVQKDPRYGMMAPHHGMPKGHLPVRSYLAVPVRSGSGAVLGGLFFGHPEPGVFTERNERVIVGLAAQAGIAIDNAHLYEAAQKAAQEREQLLTSERAARAAAERMSEVKDEFLATLSHELRTPLNAILGWAHILRSRTHEPHEYAKALETIERNARVQTQLIEDLLDMSRIAAGKVRLNVEPLQPASIVKAAVETLQPTAEAKGLIVQTFLDPEAGPISGDPGRLQQVVWNLLSNAIKFTPRQGKVQVVLERAESHIQITVADNGVGIRPEFLPHLFERFRQGDASTTRKFGGLGLGLSIVKSLVELHGGTVTVESAGEGRGTTVSVRLPLMMTSRTDSRNRRLPEGADVTVAHRVIVPELADLTVLVVDDQPDARELIKRVLEEGAATVVVAATAQEAVLLVEQHRPHILISDIGLPGVDGFELLRRIRALGPERGGSVPAIALTAFARSEDRTRALRAGFLVHIAKPVDPSELVATVASVAGRVGEK
jgi:PAS domain S-box-containing protein